MGITCMDFAVSVSDAVSQVFLVLTAQPRQATAILAHLADDTRLFERLLRYASPSQWFDLGRGVAEAFGCRAEILEPLNRDAAPPMAGNPAYRIAEQSLIARAMLKSARVGSAAASQSVLAILAIVEVEPALLSARSPYARMSVHAVAQVLTQLASSTAASVQTQTATSPRPSTLPDTTDGDALGSHAQRPRQAEGFTTESRADASSDSRSGASVQNEAQPTARPKGGASHDPAERRPPPLTPGRQGITEIRQQAKTQFGGLLYLIHLLNRWAGPIPEDTRLSQRCPRWCLHQLAMALMPVSASDPAALAFAGLLPNSLPPSEGQASSTKAEAEAIMALRQELLRDLRARLVRYDIPEARQMDFVCRREAEILADPGWVEVRFSLESVSTEIRATALDLDLGWVPWLGLVIRFVYV
jgi:hypothetical protein